MDWDFSHFTSLVVHVHIGASIQDELKSSHGDGFKCQRPRFSSVRSGLKAISVLRRQARQGCQHMVQSQKKGLLPLCAFVASTSYIKALQAAGHGIG